MSIGLCCQYIEEKKSPKGKISYNNLFEEKHLQYGKFMKNEYTTEQISQVWVHNVTKVKELLPKIFAQGIKSFRLSSNFFSLHDSVNNQLLQHEEVKSILKEVGDFVLLNQMRVTCHPDQFVVLSSKNPNVVDTAKRMLQHHAWMLDCMGLPKTPYYSINIHGGVKGESKALIKETNGLPLNVKNRLTFENDERAYNITDLMHVYQETNIPICFDSHHHTFNNDDVEMQKALELAISTWGEHKPMTHLSNTEPSLINGSFTARRKHSDYVHYIPEYQQHLNNSNKIDIEFEFKMKQLAIFKAVEELNINL